jgi:hypothetical protein
LHVYPQGIISVRRRADRSSRHAAGQTDQWDKKTVITLNEPAQVPSCCNDGHVVALQPGTNVLVLVDSLSDRLGISAMIKEGIDDRTLGLAVGHIPSIAMPAETGNG